MNKDDLLALLKKKNTPENVINAFANVKREDFVPEHLIGYAYEDMALPVEEGSTLSQPSVVAFMLSLLDAKDNQKILEIGSGSGYVLALLSELSPNGKISGIEIRKSLAISSKNHLAGRKNIEIFNRNGFEGLKEFAPFDRILISASCPEKPVHLLEQLSPNGVLVAAVKNSIFQIKKDSQGITTELEYPGFAFVPLVNG